MAIKKKKGPPAGGGRPWLSASILAAWVAVLAWLFEDAVLRRAANTDGGILFALAVCVFGYLFAAAGLWARGPRILPPWLLALSGLVPLLFYRAAVASAVDLFTLQAMPWYVAAASLFMLLCLALPNSGPDPDEERPAWRAWVLVLGLSILITAAIVLLRQWAQATLKVPADKTSLNLLYLARGVNGALDISGARFKDWTRLVAPLQFLAVSVAALVWLLRRPGLDRRLGWLVLVGLAVYGKLSISFLSDDGLGILARKISSINTNYYSLVRLIEEKGLWTYLSGYNAIQTSQGPHGETHAFGPVLFYWILTRVLGHNPGLVAGAVMVVTALAVPLLARAAQIHYSSREAGLAAAFLYLTTPMSLILSAAGIDGVVALWLALALWALARSLEDPHWKWGALAGAFFFAGSYFSFGLLVALMFAGLWSLDGQLRRARDLRGGMLAALGIWLPLLGAFFLGHLLVHALLGFKFSYLASVNAAQFVHKGINQYRTYELWSWGNVLLYSGYAGVAVLAATVIRGAAMLWRPDSRDGWLAAALPFVLTLIFACMGRAEVQRLFLFATLCLAVPAAALCFAPSPKGRRLRLGLLAAMLALNTANAVALEILVLDFW